MVLQGCQAEIPAKKLKRGHKKKFLTEFLLILPKTGRKGAAELMFFFGFCFQYFIEQGFICCPSDPLCQRMLESNPGQLQLAYWLSDALTTRLDLIHIYLLGFSIH
jgi:hypothetical protein